MNTAPQMMEAPLMPAQQQISYQLVEEPEKDIEVKQSQFVGFQPVVYYPSQVMNAPGSHSVLVMPSFENANGSIKHSSQME